MVSKNLRVTQSRQKSYAEHKRRLLSFKVGDFMYLKVSTMRGLRHFKVFGSQKEARNIECGFHPGAQERAFFKGTCKST
jgi:hypothetical protein